MKYQDLKNGRFYWEDCFDAMKEIPDGVIDLTITSPPYGEIRNYNNSLLWSFEIFKNIANEIFRLTKQGGVVVWNTNDETLDGNETGESFKQALYFKEIGYKLHDTMIWNKGSFSAVGALKTRYAPVFEYMFIFSKGKLNTFNPIKDKPNKWAGTKNHGNVRNVYRDDKIKIKQNNNEIPEFGQRFNIWDISPYKQREGFHPAPFPLKIPQDHIISWTNENDLILDPFAGSGTTAIAAINTKRRWICIEKEEEYANKAIERIKQHDVW